MYLNRFFGLFRSYTAHDRRLAAAITTMIGGKPFNLQLYKLAVRHASADENVRRASSGGTNNNERLEYLGDAILGAVVAEFLFKKFPFKDEGFLTEIRSRIVNRESLNELAHKIGLPELLEMDSQHRSRFSHKSVYGDALEALVGAVYLDKGFERCRTFVLQRLLQPHFDLEELIQTDRNFKSKLIEWAQRENHRLRFEIVKESGSQHHREFVAQVVIDGGVVSTGSGLSKKKAEQAAAAAACAHLGIEKN